MPSTFEAFWVIIFALLPGALYTWVFEREAGAWGLNLSDRLLRFVGMSAIFHAVAAPLTYEIYSRYIQKKTLAQGQPVSWWLWVVVLLYAAIPVGAGWLVGAATHKHRRWTRMVVGPAPAPSAWEHFFATPELSGWMRLRLKSGEWICGSYTKSPSSGIQSYAAGHPNSPDVYLAETAVCDPQTGQFIPDANGKLQPRQAGVLIRWDELSYIEYIKPPATGSGNV
ncbi:hypothetical protein GCM10022403_041910 [Streptomyces coacervatus]|uniref:Uncharacterized protein n=1 Tax=Streptomyces coacervatus TaxID=647381 RepID=A0ABP7HV70_9ACTN